MESSIEFRQRFVDAVEPIGDGVAINKMVYIAVATDLDTGDDMLTWGSWDRKDGGGVTAWDMYGMLQYTIDRNAIIPTYADPHWDEDE